MTTNNGYDRGESDPVLAVLEAAGPEPWTQGGWQALSVSNGEGYRRREIRLAGEVRKGDDAVVLRAVNTFAGAREALRASLRAFRTHDSFARRDESCGSDYAEAGGYCPREANCAHCLVRAALAAMERSK